MCVCVCIGGWGDWEVGEEILRRMRMLMCFPALNRTPKPLNDFSANLTHSESLRAGGGSYFTDLELH